MKSGVIDDVFIFHLRLQELIRSGDTWVKFDYGQNSESRKAGEKNK